MSRRAESAEATRGRIVEATMALHRERGIAATTMADIARRADVGIGTVYHHFPTYEDAIRACGARTAELARFPGPEVFEGVEAPGERVSVLVKELFGFYDRHPTLRQARCDKDRFPALAEFVGARERRLRELVREAVGPTTKDDEDVATVVALTDFAVHQSLLDAGLASAGAAERITDVLRAWLLREPQANPDTGGTA